MTAQEGTRNATLVWAAHTIGKDVYTGKASREAGDRACEELDHVALMTGLGPKEVKFTIRSGYAAGLQGRGCQS